MSVRAGVSTDLEQVIIVPQFIKRSGGNRSLQHVARQLTLIPPLCNQENIPPIFEMPTSFFCAR